MDRLCRMLEISRSGYYAWLHRGLSQRELNNQQLLRELVLLHEKYPAMGLNSLFFLLRNRGVLCGRGRVHRLMKQSGIHSLRKKAYRVTTNSNHKYPISPNLLQRNFDVSQPNRVWVGDITYIPTEEYHRVQELVRAEDIDRLVGDNCSC